MVCFNLGVPFWLKVNAKENRGAAMACCSQTIEEMSGCNLHLKLSVRSRGYTWDGNYSSLIGIR